MWINPYGCCADQFRMSTYRSYQTCLMWLSHSSGKTATVQFFSEPMSDIYIFIYSCSYPSTAPFYIKIRWLTNTPLHRNTPLFIHWLKSTNVMCCQKKKKNTFFHIKTVTAVVEYSYAAFISRCLHLTKMVRPLTTVLRCTGPISLTHHSCLSLTFV